MKKKRKRWVLLIVAALCVYTMIIYSFFGDPMGDPEMEHHILLSKRIYSSIDKVMNEPISVARAMASDTFVKDFMKDEIRLSDKNASDIAQRYLSTLRDGTDSYETFIVSAGSFRYFTCDGLYKIIDPVNDYYDRWYNEFITKDIIYEMNADADEARGGIWTVFVNYKVYDDAGNFLGVCGVGIEINELQSLIRDFEDEYGVKITLVDSEGLVQVDTDTINIENVYKSSSLLSTSTDYVYTSKGASGFVITQFVDSLGWYLVVQSRSSMHKYTMINPMFYVLELIGCAICGLGIWVLLRKTQSSKKSGRDAQVDELTGLYNRNYFKAVYGEHGIFNTVRYKSIAVFDIDFFKEVNDTEDGNEILKHVAESMKEVFGEKGEIFRWGGDEFMILMEWSLEFGYGLCREFCQKLQNEGKVTVSIGLTEVRLSDTIKKNYYRAAQYCYLVKEMGGNGVKRG